MKAGHRAVTVYLKNVTEWKKLAAKAASNSRDEGGDFEMPGAGSFGELLQPEDDGLGMAIFYCRSVLGCTEDILKRLVV